MKIKRFYDESLAHASYAVLAKEQVVLIDPARVSSSDPSATVVYKSDRIIPDQKKGSSRESGLYT